MISSTLSLVSATKSPGVYTTSYKPFLQDDSLGTFAKEPLFIEAFRVKYNYKLEALFSDVNTDLYEGSLASFLITEPDLQNQSY